MGTCLKRLGPVSLLCGDFSFEVRAENLPRVSHTQPSKKRIFLILKPLFASDRTLGAVKAPMSVQPCRRLSKLLRPELKEEPPTTAAILNQKQWRLICWGCNKLLHCVGVRSVEPWRTWKAHIRSWAFVFSPRWSPEIFCRLSNKNTEQDCAFEIKEQH